MSTEVLTLLIQAERSAAVNLERLTAQVGLQPCGTITAAMVPTLVTPHNTNATRIAAKARRMIIAAATPTMNAGFSV